MKIAFNKEQSELLLDLIEDGLKNDNNCINHSNLKEIKNIFFKAISYEGIIEEFVEKYKYDNDSIAFDGKEYNIGLLIKGADYHCHWDKDKSIVYLNNFIVDYKAIINAKGGLVDDEGVFKSDDYYIGVYKDFIEELKNIGVTFCEECSDEYDVLMVYSLPTDKILDDTFIDKFSTILSCYSHKFKKELDLIYGFC